MGNAEKANDASRYVFVTAFTFLSALTLRDVFALLWTKLIDPNSNSATKISDTGTQQKKAPSFGLVVFYQILLFVVVFAIAIITAVFWENYGEVIV
jgi:hypothetical protein